MDHGKDEFEGKNLDVAIWKASQELGIPIEKLRYTILSPGKRGPGGVSLEPARIRILAGDAPSPPPAPVRAVEPPAAARPAPPVEASEAMDAEEIEPAALVEAADDEEEAREELSHSEDDEDAGDLNAGEQDREDEEDEEEEDRDDDREDEDEDREDEKADSDDEHLDEDDDLEDLPLPMPSAIEEDDPIEEARRARQERGSAPERRADPPEPSVPSRPESFPRERPPRRERPRDAAPRPERPSPPRRDDAGEADPERAERPEGSGAPAVEDLEGGMERARALLPELLAEMEFDLTFELSLEEDHVYVALSGDDAAFLVDDRAEGLNSLQYLLNKMVYRGGPTRIVVDANGYRKERQQEIVARAIALAQEVRESGEPRSLGTLNPFERRLVHMALREDPAVRTVSHGDAFLKRLELVPKRADDGDRSPRFPAGWDRDGSTTRHGRPRGGRGRGRR